MDCNAKTICQKNLFCTKAKKLYAIAGKNSTFITTMFWRLKVMNVTQVSVISNSLMLLILICIKNISVSRQNSI